MSGQPTVVYSAANTQQAYLLKGLLEEQGIAAWVTNDAIQLAGGELPIGWTAAAKVVVGEQDVPPALKLVEEFDRRTAHPSTPDEGVAEAPSTEWDEWPVCPTCGERRAARCPICGAAGSDFPLADVQETPAGRKVLLVCRECDDHMVPQWYRLCARCGHDYGEGVNVSEATASWRFDLRLWLVTAILLAGVAALGAYFVWLFQRQSG